VERSRYPYGIQKKDGKRKKIDQNNMSSKRNNYGNDGVGDKQEDIKNVNPSHQYPQKRVIGFQKDGIKRSLNDKRAKAINLPEQYL